MKNIVIIGGGACGSAALIEMVHQIIIQNLQKKTQITLIERRKKVGYGLAFGSRQRSHLLNTQANLMGIFANEPAHFAYWLEENGGDEGDTVTGDDDMSSSYTSRILYGKYVEDELKHAIEKAEKSGLKVELRNDEAIDVDRRNDDKLNVSLKEGDPIIADFLLLAPGTPKPNMFKELRSYDAYIDFPWPSSRIKENIKPDDHVGVLGTSLSAIDSVMTLVDCEHKGKVTLFSPDGMLPRVQPIDNEEIERKHLTLENVHKLMREKLQSPQVKDLFRAFIKDAEEHYGKEIDWKSLDRLGKSAEMLLRNDIEAAEGGGDTLLNLAYSLRHQTAIIWNWLSIEQKKLFSKWIGRHWAVNRHAMPLYNAKKLYNLFENKALEVIPQNKDVSYDEKNKKFIITTASGNEYRVDKLINATGSAKPLEAMDNVLIENMLKKEYLCPYPLGGAVINPRTLQVISDKGGDSIFAVGHLVNGMLMDVNAVWYNVKTISSVAQEIIFKVRDRGDIY